MLFQHQQLEGFAKILAAEAIQIDPTGAGFSPIIPAIPLQTHATGSGLARIQTAQQLPTCIIDLQTDGQRWVFHAKANSSTGVKGIWEIAMQTIAERGQKVLFEGCPIAGGKAPDLRIIAISCSVCSSHPPIVDPIWQQRGGNPGVLGDALYFFDQGGKVTIRCYLHPIGISLGHTLPAQGGSNGSACGKVWR